MSEAKEKRSFYIMDAKHGFSAVAGDNYDGHVYHQDPGNRVNAKWSLLRVNDRSYPNCFFITDHKHHMFLMGTNNFSHNIQHKHVDMSRKQQFTHAMWTLHTIHEKGFGCPVYFLVNKKHGLALSAGVNRDNRLYNQRPEECRAEAHWALIQN